MSTEITINIKCVNADKASVTIESNATVLDLKGKISQLLSVPASQQRLIYKGKVMKDELGLDHYGVQHEHTVHMVKGASSTTSTSSSSAASSLPTTSQTSSIPPPATPSTSGALPGGINSNPFANLGAGMGAPAGADFNRMQEQLLRSPDMMQQIMNSPMMDNILNNPEMLRNMFLNNPQMQSMLDANPHIRHVLNDPSVLRQSMEMMRNPNAMREAMRNQDLAMSQIENLPGGFNALRRMFEDVQEPMMEAASNSNIPASPLGESPTAPATSSSATATTTPTNSAMPNPWGANSGNGATNPYASLGGMGAFGGLGNGGLDMGMGNFGMQQDPAQMAQMMSNPMVQQMMTQMMADPAMINQMAAMNPQLGVALQNPQVRAMLSNPEFMRQMLNPANLQAMNQMQQSMRTLQQSGMFGAGGFGGGLGGGAPAYGGLNFDSLFAANGMANANNPNPLFGAGLPVSTPPTTQVDPAVRFAPQLQQLQDMGFVDQAANIRALQSTGGNVNAAVERLLGGN